MADGIVIEGKSLEELVKEITCGICQEHYTEPKALPCFHYYCKQCILRLALRTGTGKPFSCPECRCEATLPEGGVDKLKTAFFVNRLKTTVSTMKRTHGKVEVKCELCSDSGDKAEAFCRQCAMFICKDCIKQHKRLKPFLTHEVAFLEDLKQGRAKAKPIIVKEPPTGMCLDHKEPLIIFCFDCESLICYHCTAMDHRDHKFEFCKKAAPKSKENLLEKLGPLVNQSESLAQAVDNIHITKQELKGNGDSVANSILTSFKELREILDKREQELLGNADGLQQLWQTQANICQLPIDPAKCTVTVKDSTKHEVSKTSNATLVTRLSSNKISRRHCKVSCSLRSLYNNGITECKVAQTGVGQYSIQYTLTVRGRHEITVSVDGQQVAGSPFPVFVSIPPIQLGKSVKVWTNFTTPTGIAVNSVGEILVSDVCGDIVKFDTKGNRQTLLKQYRLSNLCKIEIDDKKIYGIDFTSNRILKCDQNGSNIQVQEVEHVSKGLTGLAVVGGEVMVCEDPNRGTIMVYDKEMNYVRRIENRHMGQLWAISADSQGNLYCADMNNDTIQVFSNDGVFLRSFGCNGKGKKRVKRPCGLCVFGNYVYVCNRGSYKISVFTIDGVYVTSFGQRGSDEGDFNFPYSICVDRDGFVYVTDCKNMTVQCF